jgi:transposase
MLPRAERGLGWLPRQHHRRRHRPEPVLPRAERGLGEASAAWVDLGNGGVTTVAAGKDLTYAGQPSGPVFDAAAYKHRNVVKRAVTTFKNRRGLATRYDKLALVYRTGLVLAATTPMPGVPPSSGMQSAVQPQV